METNIEVKRQAFHIGLGLFMALLIAMGWLEWDVLAVVVLLGLLLSYISRKKSLPIISWLLRTFEREDAMRTMPGRGALFFLTGVLASLILFDRNTTLAALMILTFGDSIAHLFGKFFGNVKHPFNTLKVIEGSVMGFIAASIMASIFVPWVHAIIASGVAMLVEAMDLKWREFSVDDNFHIPIIAGVVLSLLKLL